MDHITQLYQNRARVLQEEVTRLEALLEAVKDIELGKTEEVSVSPSRELSTSTAGGAKKKKDEKLEERTPEQLASDRNIEAAGTILPQLVYGVAGKALEYWKPLAIIGGTELLAKGLSKKTITGRAFDIIKGMKEQAKQAKQAEVAEIARKAAAEKQIQSALRIAKDIKPGEVDPTLGVLRRPESEKAVGAVGSLTPFGREKIAQVLQSTGDELAPETKELIRAKPGETHKYLRSIGAITPEDIEAASQGLKDVAMTGKEVAGKVGRAATRPLPGSSSALATGLARGGAGIVGDIVGEYIVKPAAEKAGVFKAVESGTRSALSAAPDWVAKVADPALGVAQVILDPVSSAVSAMQEPMEQGAEKEAEELIKRAGSPSKIRFTGKSKI